jgi:hypothetical protein
VYPIREHDTLWIDVNQEHKNIFHERKKIRIAVCCVSISRFPTRPTGMTMTGWIFGMLLAAALTAPTCVAAQPAQASAVKATIDDFRWIVGHWTGSGLGGTSEEMWMPPIDGSILGSFRQVKDGKIVFYELLTFVERDGTVVLRLKHFNPDLTGWEDKAQVLEFPLIELTATKAVFNAMTFTHEHKDAFEVRLRLRDRETGSVREEVFQYRRHPGAPGSQW